MPPIVAGLRHALSSSRQAIHGLGLFGFTTPSDVAWPVASGCIDLSEEISWG